MRSIFILGALLCSIGAICQNCSSYYFLQNNKVVEMTLTDTKGKESGKLIYTVSDVQNSGGTTTAKVNTETFDKEENSIAKAQCTMKCEGGKMMVDMKASIPVPQGSSGGKQQSIDASASGDEFYLEYPSSMKEGDELPDGHANMTIEAGTGTTQKIIMDYTDRKVEGKEKVTTPAGSWDCYKISSKSKIRIEMMGIGIPMQFEQTEWFAPNFGVVRSLNEAGKIEITSIK